MKAKGTTLLTHRKLALVAGVAAILFSSLASTSFAQSLGDIARQERERKKDMPATHVYTNDDLAKAHILVPEDEARVMARKTESAPAVQPAQVAVAPAQQNSVSASAPLSVSPAISISQDQVAAESDVPATGVSSSENAAGEISPAVPSADPAKVSPPAAVTLPRAQRKIRLSTVSLTAPATDLESSSDARTHLHIEVAQPLAVAKPIEVAKRKIAIPQTRRTSVPNSESANAVRVKRGDSLWKLAVEYFGTGLRWRAIAAMNPSITNPDRVRVGELVRLPSTSELAALKSHIRSKQILVQTADRSWILARGDCGNGTAFTCIELPAPKPYWLPSMPKGNSSSPQASPRRDTGKPLERYARNL
jgi:nucleoid-associated protein YgaU